MQNPENFSRPLVGIEKALVFAYNYKCEQYKY